MNKIILLGLCSAAVVGSYLAVDVSSHTSSQIPPADVQAPTAASKPLVHNDQFASRASDGVAQRPTIKAAPPSLSKAQQIDDATRHGSEQEKYAAYKLIRACVEARKDELLQAERVADGGKAPASTAISVCGDIAPGQIASRFQLLKAAAEVGVHGAASSMADEGPSGEGFSEEMDANSPEYQAYAADMQSAIAAGVKKNDWWSLLTSSGQVEANAKSKSDYQLAMDEFKKANDAYKAETGRDLGSYQSHMGRLEYFSNKLQN